MSDVGVDSAKQVPVHTVDANSGSSFVSRTWELPQGVAAAAESMPVVTWLYDSSDGSVIWSYPVEEFLGFVPGVCNFKVNYLDDDHVSPKVDVEQGESVAELLLRPVIEELAGNQEHPTLAKKVLIDCPDGTTRSIVHQSWPVRAPEGHSAYGKVFSTLTTGVLTDVTAQQRFETELGGLVDRYRLLTEVSPDLVVVHQDGKLVYGNKAALKTSGLPSIEAGYGRSILDFVHPDDIGAVASRLGLLTEDGQYFEHGEARLLSVDGKVTYTEITSVRTTWDGRPAYQAIIRDISERRAAESVARHRASLIAHVSDAIIGIDIHGTVESWNNAAQRIYQWTEAEAVGCQLGDLVRDDAIQGLRLPDKTRCQHQRRDGTPVEVDLTSDVLTDPENNAAGWVVVCSEITDADREREDRQAAEERYEAVVASLSEGIVLFDAHGEVKSTNDAASAILGQRLSSNTNYRIFNGGTPATTVTGDLVAPEEFPHIKTLATGTPQDGVVLGVVDDAGQRQWLSVSTRLLAGSTPGSDTMVVCSFTDVTDRKNAEAKLQWMAYHDQLTGLSNRSRFEVILDGELDSNRLNGTNLAVFFIDLDRFKLVNDSFGRHAGDEVLTLLAHRIKGALRVTDTVSRFTGDEFGVLCRNVPNLDVAYRMAQEYLDLVSQPLNLSSGRTVTLSCSIGLSYIAGGDYQADQILQQADAAMLQAKQTGRAHVEVFDDDLRDKEVSRLEIYEDLRKAIANDELTVFYQPIASTSTSRVVGLEALVRWNHPTRGMLGPMEFVPLAEETDLIYALGASVLRQAANTMATWRRDVPGAQNAYVTVNLSTHQLMDPELLGMIASALSESGLPPEGLVLEVTESALMSDAIDAKEILRSINDMGIGLAIDDFGTGHSSLAQLKRFPVRILKIDKAFIDGVASFELDAAIVNTIVQLGSTFGLRVVAEGVETKEQLDKVAELGCDYYQGYLLSRPTPQSEVVFTP